MPDLRIFAPRRNAIADGWVPKYRRAVLSLLNRQWERVAEEVDATIIPRLAADFEPRFEREYAETQEPFLYAIAEDGYSWGEAEFGSSRALARLEAKQEDVIEVGGIVQARMDDVVTDFLARGSASMSATTVRQVEDTVTAGLREGDTWQELADRLMRRASVLNKPRATNVARTSTIWGLNGGARLRYQDAGAKQLEWMVTEDDRTCQFCLPQDGKRISIKEDFYGPGARVEGLEGGAYDTMWSVGHPPLHHLCRCVVLPVI